MAEQRLDVLTVPQVAQLAGVSDRRVRRACETGELAAVRLAGRWLIREVDAYRWLGRDRRRGRKTADRRPVQAEQLSLKVNGS